MRGIGNLQRAAGLGASVIRFLVLKNEADYRVRLARGQARPTDLLRFAVQRGVAGRLPAPIAGLPPALCGIGYMDVPTSANPGVVAGRVTVAPAVPDSTANEKNEK